MNKEIIQNFHFKTFFPVLSKENTKQFWMNIKYNVIVPPRISTFSFGDGLMEGMRTQVICTTTAGDEPLKLTWSKGGQVLESSSPEGDVGGGVHVSYFPPFSTILSISNVTSSNRGNFSCTVSNQVGTAVHVAELIVTGSYFIQTQKKKDCFIFIKIRIFF